MALSLLGPSSVSYEFLESIIANQHNYPEGFPSSLSLSIWGRKGYSNKCITFRKQKKIMCTLQNQAPNYFPPTSWSYDFMESIGNQNNHPQMEVEEENVNKMEMEITRMLRHKEGEVEALRLLELVDDIDRLGLGYKFEEFINKSLQRLHSSQILIDNINDLHVSALYFRLLRQHGLHISTGKIKDIFERFKDSNKRFMESLSMDRRGMLSLYEATYLAFDGENILDGAREFTRFHLNNMSTSADVDKKFGERVRHALELPSHHRMPRLEARWNIEMYDHKQNVTNQMLHKLAILDFNKVQSLHQLELQEVIRWWRGVGLVEKLSFARDRAMESFFWSVGMAFEPELSKFRVELAKVVQLITVLDDIYDVYGTPQELEQLTRAVERWDINGVNHLPYYMKLFFLALYNTVNEMAYDTLKDQNHLVVYQLKEVWADLCKSFLREAKWIHYKREIPKFDEYLNNGLISSSGVVLLTHAFFFITPTVTDEAIESLNDGHASLRSSGTIFRLANDLISSKEDNLQAVSCYMHETGLCDEEVARAYVKELIDHNWKLLNKEITYDAIFSKNFIRTCCNLARIALCQYQDGDDHSAPSDGSRNRVKSVIVDPIQLIK